MQQKIEERLQAHFSILLVWPCQRGAFEDK
jgi:hypothetical protein